MAVKGHRVYVKFAVHLGLFMLKTGLSPKDEQISPEENNWQSLLHYKGRCDCGGRQFVEINFSPFNSGDCVSLVARMATQIAEPSH